MTALREELLIEQVKVAQQYLVLQLLTTPDPLQKTIIIKPLKKEKCRVAAIKTNTNKAV